MRKPRYRSGSESGAPHRPRLATARPLAGAGLALLALTAVACGGTPAASTSPAPTSSASAATGNGTLPTANPAVAASEGTAAGQQLGTAKAPKSRTVAYLRFIAADSSDQLDYKAFTAAASAFGWKVIQCDGQGNPTVMLSCGRTLLADHPDAFVDDGIPPSLIGPVLQQAKAANIPTISFSGTLNPCAPYDACFTAPDGEMGTLLAQYVVKKMSSLPAGEQQMIVQKFPADWGVARVNAIQPVFAGSKVKVVASPTADPTNLVPGTQQQVTSLTVQYPNTRAIWITFDGAVSGAAQAMSAKFAGKQFPNAPMVVTFYQEPETLSLIQQGKVTATVYESLGWDAFVVVDQLAEHFARNKAFATSPQPAYPGKNLEFWQPRIIDASNVGSGSYPASPVDYPAYFAAKWKAEFGLSDSSMATALNPIP